MQLANPFANAAAPQPGKAIDPLVVLTLNATVPVCRLSVTEAISVTGAPYAATVVFDESVIDALMGVTISAADGKPVPILLRAVTVQL